MLRNRLVLPTAGWNWPGSPVLCEISLSHIVVPHCPGVQSHQRLKLKHLLMEVPLAVAWFGAVSHKRSVGLMTAI